MKLYVPELLTLFILVLLIGYYYDYRRNKEIYKDKGQEILYLVAIAAIILILIILAVLRFL